MGSIPGWETKILHAVWHGQKKKEKEIDMYICVWHEWMHIRPHTYLSVYSIYIKSNQFTLITPIPVYHHRVHSVLFHICNFLPHWWELFLVIHNVCTYLLNPRITESCFRVANLYLYKKRNVLIRIQYLLRVLFVFSL